jgi:hypothetical protein
MSDPETWVRKLTLRRGRRSRAEWIVDGLQGFLLKVDISEIVVHEADEPSAVVGLLEAELLTGEHGRILDLLFVPAGAAAVGLPAQFGTTSILRARQACELSQNLFAPLSFALTVRAQSGASRYFQYIRLLVLDTGTPNPMN